MQRLDGDFSAIPARTTENEETPRLSDWREVFSDTKTPTQLSGTQDESNLVIDTLSATYTEESQSGELELEVVEEQEQSKSDPDQNKGIESRSKHAVRSSQIDTSSSIPSIEKPPPYYRRNQRFESVPEPNIERALSSLLHSEDITRITLRENWGGPIRGTITSCRELYAELIFRADRSLDKQGFDDALKSIPLLQSSLKENRALQKHGTNFAPNGDSLTSNQRWNTHKAILGDLDAIYRQIQLRQDYARLLIACEHNADAESVLIEARDLSEKMLQPIELGDKKFCLSDLVTQEIQQLTDDQLKVSDPNRRYEMELAKRILKGSVSCNGFIKAPINTNKSLAEFYLAPDAIQYLYGDSGGGPTPSDGIHFGTTNAFKPQKAFEAAVRAKQHIEFLYPNSKNGLDIDPHLGQLFAGLSHVLDHPEKFDLYRLDENGKPKIISKLEADNLKRELAKYSGYSFLVDAGMTALTTGAMLLAHNPKVMAGFEKSMRHLGVAADRTFVKAAGVGAAFGAGVAARHYAFEAVTGVEEDWSNSTTRFLGSAAFGYLAARAIKAPVNPGPGWRVPESKSVIRSLSATGLGIATIGKDFNPLQLEQHNRTTEMLKKLQQPIENKR